MGSLERYIKERKRSLFQPTALSQVMPKGRWMASVQPTGHRLVENVHPSGATTLETSCWPLIGQVNQLERVG